MNPLIESFKGEPGRYLVSSRSGGDPWLVDINDFFGNGSCTCFDFDMRMRTKLESAEEQGQRISPPLRCWHLQQAFAAVRNETRTTNDENEQDDSNGNGHCRNNPSRRSGPVGNRNFRKQCGSGPANCHQGQTQSINESSGALGGNVRRDQTEKTESHFRSPA